MAQDKKVALITGANRGIGFETAKQLGEKGVTVLVASRKLSDARTFSRSNGIMKFGNRF